ncbi:MAG: RNA polymerase sigma factor [Polyangiaceae bacterium]
MDDSPGAPPSDAAEGPDGPDPDAPLVERAKAGDRGAFDALFARHDAAIFGLVRRYVKNEADARDVTQRAFLKAFEHLASFRGAAAFRTWLHRIAVHEALTHLRVRDRTEPAELDELPAFTHSLTTGKLVRSDLWRKVEARLADLPPKQRAVLELRVFHDLSFKEIAPLVGTTEDSAKMSYSHAVQRLRDVLKWVKT